MDVVADSSVIAAICLSGGRLGPLTGHTLHGPAHLCAEVTSSIRERQYRGDLDDDLAERAIAELSGVPVAYATPDAVSAAAHQLAVANGWAKTYDAEFVALARQLDCPLVTLDGRLQRGAAHLARILAPSDLEPQPPAPR